MNVLNRFQQPVNSEMVEKFEEKGFILSCSFSCVHTNELGK